MQSSGRLGLFFFFLASVFLLESLHATCRVNDLLFTRDKGMALGTDFHLDVFPGGPGMDYISTDTAYRGLLVFRMNTFFHNRFLSSVTIRTFCQAPPTGIPMPSLKNEGPLYSSPGIFQGKYLTEPGRAYLSY
jgi:hypothetical protein